MTTNPMGEINLQVMWKRLLSVVEEQAQTLVRTAFSTSSREAGDISAGVFDLEGQMLAQAVTGTPGHINSMARSVKHFLDVFPAETMKEGDSYFTNDPWKGTGHLNDLTIVSPTFKGGRMVALFACTSHLVDIGGLGPSSDGKQIYHEGLFIPIMPLAREGVMDHWVLNLVKANVREPVQVEGDIYALVACNETGSGRLLAMMEEYALDDLDVLGEHIIRTSRQGMADAINELPKGSWSAEMRIDGYEAPLDLKAMLTIGEGEILVDFAGTSGVSEFGINCPLCYTEAYTSFGVKCVVGAAIPNNAGTLDAIRVIAPEGSIVNAPHPCAVVARASIGHMLPDVVFGCLHQALPEVVPAEGTSNLWNLKLGAGHGMTGPETKSPFMMMSFHSGGAGARPNQDGLSATPYPSGVRNVPVEITEAITPLVVWRKEYRENSGGPGRQRGGLGQTMVVANREDGPFGIFATFERVHFPARGREGGGEGAKGRLHLTSGEVLRNKGFQPISKGERLIVEMPGGGGYGNPKSRDPASVAADARAGFIDCAAAESDYGVVFREGFEVDPAGTAALRKI